MVFGWLEQKEDQVWRWFALVIPGQQGALALVLVCLFLMLGMRPRCSVSEKVLRSPLRVTCIARCLALYGSGCIAYEESVCRRTENSIDQVIAITS